MITVLRNFVSIYSTCLVLYALLSWFPGGYQSKFGQFLTRICDPYLKIFDRFNLSIGGISFNIVVALFVLQFIERILIRILFVGL
ncbi:YggT family protein [Vagococcus zengguangii]|uniref:YggT family protein n=1 Tax=Vagococcus zengguangii TaxID=2571750 RepID=A0A4D7CTV9_9ENTE|nr:YggT family protein [Vagococcus zengguangii]QCI87388.1 YggT family protein [Vagococcus zengguangii]TLG79518.1 YggT family protein [Vagococcus zengguangii]